MIKELVDFYGLCIVGIGRFTIHLILWVRRSDRYLNNERYCKYINKTYLELRCQDLFRWVFYLLTN